MSEIIPASAPPRSFPPDQLARIATPDGCHEFFVKLGVTLNHPVLKLPSPAKVAGVLAEPDGLNKFLQGMREREELIRLMVEDPFNYGWEPDQWRDADETLKLVNEICVLGGNRAGKTEWPAKRLVQLMVRKPGARVWCFHTTSETSIRDQQPVVYKYLPLEWKAAKKGRVTNINYTVKNGFADGTFVAPNGSQCWFMNYKQDRDVIEGGEVDFWWADELIPIDWLLTLRLRYVTRAGKGVVTFTPVHGFTPTVGEYISGAEVTRWIDSDLLPNTVNYPKGKPGQVPYIMRCLNPKMAVIFFQSRFNPFSDYTRLRETFIGKSSSYILIRAHGVAEKVVGNVFPKFGKHNVIPHDKIPKTGTNYVIMDFAWNRNWAILWFRVEKVGKDRERIYIYREWPDYETYGEWAIPSTKPDGERGPAQRPLGYGCNDYKRMMLQKEGHTLAKTAGTANSSDEIELIHVRYGDPRSGRATALTEDGGTCIIDKMAETDADEYGEVPAMFIEPALGVTIAEGVNMINKWLAYDEEKPMGILNEPTLYISERCKNTIDCLKIWTGQDGEKGASKDFIDLLRYAAVMRLSHVEPKDFEVTNPFYMR
jgi:hypothetical protein